MRHLIQISFATMILASAGLAQSTNTWFEQWHKAKYGRYSAAYEARQKAEHTEIAFREKTQAHDAQRVAASGTTSTWIEQLQKANTVYIRHREEARHRAEGILRPFHAQTAFSGLRRDP